jgi:hypothetical protein
MRFEIKKSTRPSTIAVRAITLFAPILALGVMSGSAFAQANPSAVETEQARTRGPCRDPWVSIAVGVAKATFGPLQKGGFRTETAGRAAGSGDSGECNPALYRGGHWDNYAELITAVLSHRHCDGVPNTTFTCAFDPTRQAARPAVEKPAAEPRPVAAKPAVEPPAAAAPVAATPAVEPPAAAAPVAEKRPHKSRTP